jgi:group I intron endonuclease
MRVAEGASAPFLFIIKWHKLRKKELCMPYKIDVCGIYKLVNKVTGQCYVGQSQRVRKRIKEHFRLLRWNKHTNPHLQNAYNKYGTENFYGAIEVECQNLDELDQLENAFLCGEAWFDEPTVYNIADFAKAPMRGKNHSEEVRLRIRLGRRATTFDYRSSEYRKTLSIAQMARFHSDPKFIAKLKFIVENDHMSYAERARSLCSDTSAVRRLALKYQHLKGVL